MSAGERTLSNLARLSKMIVSVNKSGTCAQVLLPGFCYDDFDRTGLPACHNLIRLFNKALKHLIDSKKARQASEQNQCGRVQEQCISTSTEFPGLIKLWKVGPTSTSRFDPYRLTVRATSELTHTDKCILTYRTTLTEMENEILFAKCDTKMDYSVPGHEHPLSVPSGNITPNPSIFEPIPRTPEDTFSAEFSVEYSWLNHHGKVSDYFLGILCMQTAAMANDEGMFSVLQQDLVYHPVKVFSISYIQDIPPDTSIKCHTWQDMEDSYKLYFQVEDGQSRQVLCQAAATFWSAVGGFYVPNTSQL